MILATASVANGVPTSVIVPVTIVVFVLMSIAFTVQKLMKKRRQTVTVQSGRRTTGLVTMVKGKTYFDRERGDIGVDVKLSYRDPTSGRTVFTEHVLEPTTRNLPPEISGPGAGITDVQAIAALHGESMRWRAELAAQGLSESEIRAKVRERALEQAEASSGVADSEGYLTIRIPVPVTVYVRSGAGSAKERDGIVVEFAPR